MGHKTHRGIQLNKIFFQGDSDGCEWQCPEGEHLVPGSGLTFLCEPDNDDFVCNVSPILTSIPSLACFFVSRVALSRLAPRRKTNLRFLATAPVRSGWTRPAPKGSSAPGPPLKTGRTQAAPWSAPRGPRSASPTLATLSTPMVTSLASMKL